MDNTAIERIATPDLTKETVALLERYATNDDVVFFLGRLVWQGEMKQCVPALAEIACDNTRGLYARIASIRGVMSVGDIEQKDHLWRTIANQTGPLDRRLLAEILEGAEKTSHSAKLLLQSIENLAPFERFNRSGLEDSLHNFIDLLPLMADEAENQPLYILIEGFNDFLCREPFIARGECQVSEYYAWLMAPALHVVDRLVSARSAGSFLPSAIAVMRNMPALRFWQGDDYAEYKLSLDKNVPRWQELNDTIYWTSIDESRSRLSESGQSLVDDWQISYMGHFWSFGPGDFERCVEWVRTKSNADDQLVALARCVNLYVQADRPAAWLKLLRVAVGDDEKLKTVLEMRLDPRPSPAMEKIEAEHREGEQQRDARDREQEQKRAEWVCKLKKSPNRVLYPPGLKPGEFSADQYHLLTSLSRDHRGGGWAEEANWRGLIPEFGEAVARAYRDAAIAHWRAYIPRLRSEGAAAGSTPYSLVFAMVGLFIEADDNAFVQRLTPDEARHAFRYVTWELNGFPNWFEPLYRAHPAIGLEAVTEELKWELEHSIETQPTHYILYDILYYAPWLHAAVAPVILNWLSDNDMPNADGLR